MRASVEPDGASLAKQFVLCVPAKHKWCLLDSPPSFMQSQRKSQINAERNLFGWFQPELDALVQTFAELSNATQPD